MPGLEISWTAQSLASRTLESRAGLVRAPMVATADLTRCLGGLAVLKSCRSRSRYSPSDLARRVKTAPASASERCPSCFRQRPKLSAPAERRWTPRLSRKAVDIGDESLSQASNRKPPNHRQSRKPSKTRVLYRFLRRAILRQSRQRHRPMMLALVKYNFVQCTGSMLCPTLGHLFENNRNVKRTAACGKEPGYAFLDHTQTQHQTLALRRGHNNRSKRFGSAGF
jgi:hypothetical protein